MSGSLSNSPNDLLPTYSQCGRQRINRHASRVSAPRRAHLQRTCENRANERRSPLLRPLRRHDRRLVERGPDPIDPWDTALIQPASVDLRLGDSFRVFHNHKITAIDLREPPRELTEQVSPPPDEPFVIHPGEFCLGRTLEHVELPDDIVARIEGKSSLGRLGLIVHATAGFCDPGWQGTLTLELNNLTRVPIKLWPGLPIAQLSFMTLDAPALRPYGHADLGSHYQGQVEATESRYGAARMQRR